ncbi:MULTISPECIES: conjugal transfer protein TraM [Xanthomonas]|uniref:Conjugal transfer protein TraM n=1 Tax=Xanthomonas hortorum pv. vitians TaxID=83224 RepID=A0AAW8ZQI2_9XANT|nr:MULTISPECIES: conjugal transfer protein TraM [Xanthomonas]KGP23784.1 conjugal transfer protein TraM [Xanthomonas citri pv. fuscans]KGT57583.1 conjugal transfer protein TraM [Xanthomonas citri pv. fuscans]MDV7248920.1 conjugal transfer protein TraM [Xanthomonas hortorum pv. vitians]
MSDKIEDLIREIAVKHGIAVGRDDPILVLQTINASLMADSAAQQQEILDRFKEELEGIAHRWGEDAKGKAERILNAALAASKEGMAKVMKDSAASAADAIRREVEEVVVIQVSAKIADARRLAVMNLIAGGMVLAAAAMAVWATL